MIDIHSHILPAVDDGARNFNEALDMLKMAIDGGVTTQVLTPHIQPGRFDNTKQHLTEKFLDFKNEVERENLQVELRLAAEMHIGPELMVLANQNAIPSLGTLNGKKTFLLEFPRVDIPFASDNLVRWLLAKEYLPIIVHPERNRTFLNHPEKLDLFISLGCPIQITACSLTGKFGQEVQKMTEELLLSSKVNAIASDCHNLKGRKPDLHEGIDRANAIIGSKELSALIDASQLIQ